MSEHINTYSACDVHKNGHSEHCMGCEVDALRNLLREVAKNDAAMVALPRDLFEKLAVLRTPPIVKVNGNG